MDPEDPSSRLLDYAQDKIAVVEADGTFVYCNAATERHLGFERSELIGENAIDLIHPDDVERVRSRFEAMIAAEEPTTETIRYRYRRADGSYVHFESRMSNATDESIGGYVVSSRDVSDQVVEQRRRRESEARLTELSETVCDVLWMFDADWSETLFVNPAYEAVYGGSIERLREDPRSFLDVVHPEDREVVRDAMARLSAGESVDVEYRIASSESSDKWVWVQGHPIVEDGEVVRIVGFTRDVTDRRRRERQLAVMDNLLRHNLRNDVSIVLGNAGLIASDDDEAASERAEEIRQVGSELLETASKQREIIDLLTRGNTTEVVDVVAVVTEAVEEARERFPAATIELDVPDAARARGLHELSHAVTELIDNAVRHAPVERPTVTVTVTVTEDAVELQVDDDCPPIPDEEHRVLTGEREMTDVYHTTGLGLWLVHWAVELSEGVVSFERREDGNRVTVSLSRAA